MSLLEQMLPPATRVLVEFAPLLRANGFAISPDQTMGFVEGVGLLGPSSILDIRRAAVALLAIPQNRRADFDALFDAHFLGASLPQAMPGSTANEAMSRSSSRVASSTVNKTLADFDRP